MNKITTSKEDYLKAIWTLSERETGGRNHAATKDLAKRLSVSPPAVSRMLKQMQNQSLVTHIPYFGVSLTAKGREVALHIVRRHRLIELFLTRILNYSPQSVHAEAERLEHHVSDEFEAKIDALLGFPDKCPHGSPIPNRNGGFKALNNSVESLWTAL
ncbi:MAG: metal-dependent transcriptional regulator [Pyrinomonadaceae bacterium]